MTQRSKNRCRYPDEKMEKIDCGGARATLEIRDDGIATARVSGVVATGNAGPISSLVLSAGVERKALGFLSVVDRALVALPPIDPEHYSYVPPHMRNVPVAVIVSPEQYGIYARIVQAAAIKGAIRRPFLERDEAELWIREQIRAIRANQGWWSGQRRAAV